MEASIQKLILELKAVVFGKDELEFRDMSELKELLPPLANQDSNSDEKIKVETIQKPTVRFKYKAID